jgi:DNA-binding response OmpR family regulator
MADQRHRVLLIGEVPALQRLTARLLEQAGYVVTTAPTGEEGLRLARQCPPDIVLLNVALPDMSGVEVCRRIRGEPALAAACIILLSHPGTGLPPQAAIPAAEADGYISHPISEREFLTHMEALARLKRAAEALRLDRARLETLYRLSQMVNEPEQEIKDFALEAGVAMTRSKIGYIYFMS